MDQSVNITRKKTIPYEHSDVSNEELMTQNIQ